MPQQRRQRTLEALTSQLAGLASRQPVLMIFEDAQWIDPTSLEALSRIIERIRSTPVLLFVTFRSELGPESDDEQHWGAADALDYPAQRLEARRIGPRGLLEERWHRLAASHSRGLLS